MLHAGSRGAARGREARAGEGLHALVIRCRGADRDGWWSASIPRRPLDDRYRAFLELVADQVGTALGNARAYEAERKRAEALAQLDRAKTVFFSNVSHEFRTPLSLMLGPTEEALASPERALTGEALEIVHRNELRLLKLVNTLLDFSRIEAGRADASYVPTDLAEFTADIASTFRSAFMRAGLEFVVDCPALSQPVFVDREMWEKIVLNLLSNALKFTLDGSVHLSLLERAGVVELGVRDTGVGIPDSEIGARLRAVSSGPGHARPHARRLRHRARARQRAGQDARRHTDGREQAGRGHDVYGDHSRPAWHTWPASGCASRALERPPPPVPGCT